MQLSVASHPLFYISILPHNRFLKPRQFRNTGGAFNKSSRREYLKSVISLDFTVFQIDGASVKAVFIKQGNWIESLQTGLRISFQQYNSSRFRVRCASSQSSFQLLPLGARTKPMGWSFLHVSQSSEHFKLGIRFTWTILVSLQDITRCKDKENFFHTLPLQLHSWMTLGTTSVPYFTHL